MTDNPTPEPQTIDTFWIRDMDFEIIRYMVGDTPFYGMTVRVEGDDYEEPDRVIHLTDKHTMRLSSAIERMNNTVDHDRKQFPIRKTISTDEVLKGLAGEDGDPEELRRQILADREEFLHAGVPGWTPKTAAEDAA